MREEPKIAREELRVCLREQYDLVPAAIEFLPLGADSNAGVYRIESEQGTSYFVKIKSTSFYPPSCLVPSYLFNQGIASVVAPLPTKTQSLWTRLGEWSAVIYPFIDGDTGWHSITSKHWTEAGRILKQIHGVALPASGFDGLRRESFDPAVYLHAVDVLAGQLADSRGSEASPRTLDAVWTKHLPTTRALLESLRKLGTVLRGRSLPHVICHADLHPGNLLRDGAGHVFVVDWDDVMLAPRERDFIFTGEPSDGTTDGSPFFQGYGKVEVDWTAITYYRYERVVQDLIYCAQDVFREDLSEETRANSVRRFRECFEEVHERRSSARPDPGRNFKAAQVAAAHVAPELTVSSAGDPTLDGH